MSFYALTIIGNVASRLDILPNIQSRSTRAETSQGNKIARHFHHTSMHLHVYNGGHSTQCSTTIEIVDISGVHIICASLRYTPLRRIYAVPKPLSRMFTWGTESVERTTTRVLCSTRRMPTSGPRSLSENYGVAYFSYLQATVTPSQCSTST